jgi:fatty-acyl-CoA synthase
MTQQAFCPVAQTLGQPRSINDWWHRLAAIEDRGIHVLDDATNRLVYQPYAEMCRQASAMAAVLSARGVGRGDGVLLCAETRPEFPVLWFALMRLGAVPVPLPPKTALAGENAFFNRIRHIVPHFGFYIHKPDELGEISKAAGERADALVCWTIDSLREEAARTAPLSTPPVELRDDDLAFYQYTSGSTSRPKGIRVTYANLEENLRVMSRRLKILPERDTVMTWLPLYHDMGLIGMYLQAAWTLSPQVLMKPQAFVKHPLRLFELIAAHRGTICSMPNFAYEILLKRALPGVAIPDLSSMRWFGVGAEPVRVKTTQAFSARFEDHGLRPGVVSPCYGLAEATLAVSIDTPLDGHQVVQHGTVRHATCGSLLDGFEARLDPQTKALLIKGRSVASTALVGGEVVSLLDEDGFYNTRDVVEIVDGRLVILGRVDEMFVVNGENRFPYDIEAAVRTVCGETTRAACFQIPQGASGRPEVVVLYERRADQHGQSDHDEALKDRIHGAVLSHAGLRIDRLIAVDFKTLPVTPSGKIQRVQARQHYLQGRFTAEAEAALAV